MKNEYFSFSNGTHNIRSKLLILSGISLFIGLTEELPKKFSPIGLDLSNNPELLGWFLFFITLAVTLNFLIVSILDLIKYYLPSLIKKETDKTTGDTLGFTFDECIKHQECHNKQHENVGTTESELGHINRKNITIENNYKIWYTKSHDFAVIIIHFIFSFVFSIFGMYYMYNYLYYTK